MTALPFKFEKEPKDKAEERLKFYNAPGCSVRDNLVVTNPGGVILPKDFVPIAEGIYNFELRPDDVWVVTYPKCGTTWMKELAWQVIHDVDLDYKTSAGGKEHGTRVPFIEFQMFYGKIAVDHFGDTVKSCTNTLDQARTAPSPRCIKTHLPLDMLPKDILEKCKVIYVARNPRDCCVSYFHHQQLIPTEQYGGDFANFERRFREGQHVYGDIWHHMSSAWKVRNHPNLEFVWFEEMKTDLKEVIRRVAQLIGKVMSQEDVTRLADHLGFDKMQKNSAINNDSITNEKTGQRFMRKGIVGDWKNHFNDSMTAEWDKWMAQKKLEFNMDHEFLS